MEPDKILSYCLDNLDDVVLAESWGEKGIFYNPQNILKRGIYILTVKEKDGENDKSSDLNRDNIYRVNLGVRKKTFIEIFGDTPPRPAKGKAVDMDYDFSELNRLIPHPVYAWMSWICILNPSEQAFEHLKPLIQEAYEYATEKFRKRKL